MKAIQKEIDTLNALKQSFLTPITFFLEGDRFYVARRDDIKNRSMVGTFHKRSNCEYEFIPRTKTHPQVIWTIDGATDIFQQVCAFMTTEHFFENIRDLGPLDDFVGDMK